MSSGSIRIIQLPEKSSVNTDDYMAVDSSANGTKKVKFTDLLDDNLSTQNKAADAQATGEAINDISARVDNTNARVDNMINTQTNAEVTTLWTGRINLKNETANLSESINNFDFIDVYCGGTDTVFARQHVSGSSVHFELQAQNMSDDASVQFMRWWETGLTISGTTVTINKAIQCYWDDFSQHPIVSQATGGGIDIVRIDGVKIGHADNDEVVDARVGANGVIYPMLGDAIRGQVTDLNSEISDIEKNLGYEDKIVIHAYFNNLNLTTNAQSPFIVANRNHEYDGRSVSAIKLKVAQAGTISIGYIEGVYPFSGTYDPSLVTVIDVVTAPGLGEQIISLNTPFTIPAGCSVFIGMPTDTGRWKYGYLDNTESYYAGFYYINNGSYTPSSGLIGVDFIERSGINVNNALNSITDTYDNILDVEFGINHGILIQGYDSRSQYDAILSNAPYVLMQSTSLCLIEHIKFYAVTTGTLSIGYINYCPAWGYRHFNENDVVVTNEIVVNNNGVIDIDLSNPFIVPENGSLCIGLPTDTCQWRYDAYGEDTGFLFYSRDNEYWVDNVNSLGFDISGFNHKNYKEISEEYPITKADLGILMDNLSDDIVFYDGFNSNNATRSGSATSPFIVEKHMSGYVESIKINIASKGTLSIGTIKASDVVYGESFDFDDVKIHEILNFTELGEQIYTLKNFMEVLPDEYIVLNVRTDSATFYYGANGTDIGFYFVNDTTVKRSSASLGITFNGFKINTSQNVSIYKDKTLSILGDSISTFSGYIPEGNLTYYPSGTVQSVSDTWWYKLYTALGMTLNVNNSWSGSRVTTTAGETSAGCMTRCQSLGESPDVIIVWMGINDFNNEVALGTYDGASAMPTATNTFREAYAIMLNKILTKYQSSEVWVCTLPQCERNAESGFPEINGNGVALAEFNKAIRELADAFGVKVLDHNKCGLTYQNMPTFNPDNLHPNKYGHSLVANNDIRQMDNVVRTRYSIA